MSYSYTHCGERRYTIANDYRVSHNYYGGGGSPITFVLPRQGVEAYLRHEMGDTDLTNYVNNRLYELGARYPGTVHSWTYCNGDVRYTFQPESR